ncbi:uncharacterized protein GGS25DRAFT_521523 [Hypoxylon fragiforme]|uniref:uncharacterized protein n=1 Tax=Hypoxylon fragiforme TaxID=63214 RepID=UPI0020C67B7F|nr:uncharacterized protein GGS25DRAFT_521523 [Hypoxylon fragiforme]KAI2608349.1 hypothetical protein GGS25DRAFT_521523 [Hypoxylon fragiforme]
MRTQPILFTVVAILASQVIAQDDTTTANTGDATSTAQDVTTTAQTTADTPTTTTEQTSEQTTDPTSTAASETTTEASTTSDTSRTTGTSSDITSSTTRSSASTSSSDDDVPLPTLPGQYSYPSPTVPPTSNAPFMQPSSVPEGTVFIAVGAILGAFGAAVLIWRAVVACLLHRSVKKAAMAQQLANDKATFPPPPAPFYKYTDQASSASLGNAMAGRGVRRTTRGPIPSSTPSQSNLFFSPTAATPSGSVNNRESRFLPSGFYAAGQGSPQSGHGHSISLTNLRPDSRGVGRPLGHTPPESPSLAPRADMVRQNMSASSLNLNRPPSGRAPSAFLEDLLDDPQNQFPPPTHPSTWNQSQRH